MAASPMARRSAGAGTRSQGRSRRPRAAASAAVNSELVTGSGAVRFTGPARSPRPSRNRSAAISSCSEIQLITWVPGPNLGSRPSLASGSSLASSPPRGLSTRPLRTCTTRMPAFAAGSAAASQSLTTPARNVLAGGADSSTARPPVSPYQPIADAVTSVAGGMARLASAPASARVPSTLLALTSALYPAVQRRSATPAPARCTHAPIPVSSSGSTAASAAPGSHRTSSADRAGRRTSLMTRWPSARKPATSAVPISPDEPVTATFIGPRAPAGLHAEFRLERPFFQPGFDRGEVPGRVGAVDQPVVVGQRQVHHGTHRDHLAQGGVIDHDRPLHHRPGAEDRDLRLVDDGGVEQRAATAGVGQRERAAGQLVRAYLPGPGTLRQVADLARQPADVQVARVVDDRHHEAALGVHRDAEVLGVMVGDLVPIEHRVELRVHLERLD